MQNPKKAYEIGAAIAGFSEDEIRQLLDTSEFGNAELISEAEADIEAIIDGQAIPVNQQATIAYKQHFIDYLQDNQEHLDEKQVSDLFAYMDKLNPVIIRNMQRDLARACAYAGSVSTPARVSTTRTKPRNAPRRSYGPTAATSANAGASHRL